jgi:hypothetical protein
MSIAYTVNQKKVDELDIPYVCARLNESHPKLTEINYSKRYLKTSTVQSLLESVTKNKALLKLDLSLNRIEEGKKIFKKKDCVIFKIFNKRLIPLWISWRITQH